MNSTKFKKQIYKFLVFTLAICVSLGLVNVKAGYTYDSSSSTSIVADSTIADNILTLYYIKNAGQEETYTYTVNYYDNSNYIYGFIFE